MKKRAKAKDADRARQLAIEYCLFHYATMYTGGVPEERSGHWYVPIRLEDPGAGLSEEVGQLQIDVQSGRVIAATDRAAVLGAGEKLYVAAEA